MLCYVMLCYVETFNSFRCPLHASIELVDYNLVQKPLTYLCPDGSMP